MSIRGCNDLLLLRVDDLTNAMLTKVGVIAVHVVAEKRSTFSRANVLSEVLRQIHGVRFASADDWIAVVERTAGLALVQAGIEGFSADVERALLAVAALAEPTVELVQLAAGAADGLEAEVLLEYAEKGCVIAIDGHRVRFTHPLPATGVYSATSPPSRPTRHAGAARRGDDSVGAAAANRRSRHKSTPVRSRSGQSASRFLGSLRALALPARIVTVTLGGIQGMGRGCCRDRWEARWLCRYPCDR